MTTNRKEKGMLITTIVMSVATATAIGCGIIGERGLVSLISIMIAGIASGFLFEQAMDKEERYYFIKTLFGTLIMLGFVIVCYIIALACCGHLF